MVRRDVGMLGLLHKRVLGFAHPAYEQLLPFAPLSWYQGSVVPRHGKQLDNGRHLCTARHALFTRSLFGMVDVYNRLPARFIAMEDISLFQKELTAFIKHRCNQEIVEWKQTFQSLRFASALD